TVTRRGGRVRPSSKWLSPFLTSCSVWNERGFRALRSATKGRCPLETRSLERLANFFESAASPPERPDS
ncbi:MAG: hypothetical protein K2J72_00310, partial [Oscillospiraceae bacterium]|nr:hypothetical protein [Oscillospiraceae bacterium]